MPSDQMRHHANLPEGAIALSVVEVVEFIDTDGKRGYCHRHDGDTSCSTTVGLLEMAKHQFLADNRNPHGYGD